MLRDLRQRMEKVEPQVEALVEGKKIADAVATRIHSGRVNVLTTGQKLFGIVVGGITVAASIKVFIGG